MKEKFKELKPYYWRIVFIITFVVFAILLMTIGFFKSLLLLIFALIGYVVGVFFDDPKRFARWLEDLQDRF